MTSADPNRQKLTQLRKLLIKHFSLDELRVLCFDLGLEYEELPGDTRTTKMHGLIEYLQRRGELPRLLAEANEYRPNVAWPSFDGRYQVVGKDEPTGNPQSFIHEKSGLEMLLIPAGVFLYGEEKRLAYLPNYWIAKTPVTNAHYLRFVQTTGYQPPKHWRGKYPPAEIAQHPVVEVSWHDAAAFSEWTDMRLPSDEEWEKAARSTDGRKFPWGNDWIDNGCNTYESDLVTTPVGKYSPQGDSAYGCVDMCGNVWEWINSNNVDSTGNLEYVRGGAWIGDYRLYDVFARKDEKSVNLSYVGFRPVREMTG